MQECYYALLCLPVPTSPPLPPIPPSRLSFTHTHTYIHRNTCTLPPLQSWQYCTSQMPGLMVYKQRSVLVKCIILACLLLDIHGFIYKSLCSTFFSSFYGLYHWCGYTLVGISSKNQDITGKYSVMQSAFP